MRDGERNWAGAFPSDNQKPAAIGLCLIRQSSVSPIVCLRRPNQISAHTIGMPRRFLVVVWLMGGGWGYPAAHPSGDKELKVNKARLILNAKEWVL